MAKKISVEEDSRRAALVWPVEKLTNCLFFGRQTLPMFPFYTIKAIENHPLDKIVTAQVSFSVGRFGCRSDFKYAILNRKNGDADVEPTQVGKKTCEVLILNQKNKLNE